jgi:uncharacterized Zn-binding protein involved in type VI secretion
MRPVAGLANPDSTSSLPCCVYPSNTVTPAVTNVFINGRPVSLVGDALTPAPGFPVCRDTSCPPMPRVIVGVSKTFCNGKPLARVGDLTNVPSGRIILPFPTNVFSN